MALPINSILADGIVIRKEPKRNGVRIVMDGEVIWDFPREFANDPVPNGAWGHTIGDSQIYGYHIRDLYRFLKRYMDTPRAQLDDFEGDYCGLRDLLLSADKRRGRHINGILAFSTDSAKARKVFDYRVRKKKHAP